MAVGALADQMEKPFINYMEAFLPILIQGLSNNEEYQVRRFFMWCRWVVFFVVVIRCWCTRYIRSVYY